MNVEQLKTLQDIAHDFGVEGDDEGFACVSAAIALLRTLPTTRDGVIVFPGMEVWVLHHGQPQSSHIQPMYPYCGESPEAYSSREAAASALASPGDAGGGEA